jgi:hypothetical protein
MASPAQIAANRANAQKSTGPRSAEGKSASRFNALKHGIDAASIVLPGEDSADYDALVAGYQREYPARCASESFHVETMIRADWQKRRLEKVETELYRTVLSESPGKSLAAALLSATPAAKLLARLQRQIAAFERTWRRAAAEFRRFRVQHLLLSEPIPARSPQKHADSLGAPFAELASFLPAEYRKIAVNAQGRASLHPPATSCTDGL